VARKNWNCDGNKCTDPKGETRVYPLGSGGNLILCRECFAHENRYRRLRCEESGRQDWPTFNWNEAKPYPEISA
jgi:hypothetical protein